MVHVNGKHFKIYKLDSISSFKNAYAANKDTTPELLFFKNKVLPEDLHKKEFHIKLINVLKALKNLASKNKIPLNILEIKGIDKETILSLWMSYNSILENEYKSLGKQSLDNVASELIRKNYFKVKNQVYTIWNNRKYVQNRIEDEISLNKKKIQKQLKIYKEFEEIKDGWLSTDPIIENIKLSLELNLTISLLEFFNNIILDNNVPYSNVNNKFFKILKDFIPPHKWVNFSHEKNFLLVKVNKKNFDKNILDIENTYSSTIFDISSKGNITAHVSLDTGKNDISREEYIKRFLKIFKNDNIKITNSLEESVTGTFYYPQYGLNNYVLADLIMNDPIFSMLMNVNEQEKTTKKKSGLYIHFNHPLTGHISATITTKKRTSDDISMKYESKEIFPMGENYIRVRVAKAKDFKSMKYFQKLLGYLINRYDQKYNEILNFYREYIPNFGVEIKENKKESNKNLSLSKQVPEVFVPQYTRNCKLNRNPALISEEKALPLIDKGKAIKFPRDPIQSGLPLPSDGKNQYYYTCNHPEFPFIGLKKNKLSNSNNFPFVPCCFIVDQRKKDDFRQYYEGKIPSHQKIDHNQTIIKTDKILSLNQYGVLPDNIKNFFTLINTDHDYEEIRQGVERSPNSFIQCIVKALDIKKDVKNIRKKLATPAYAALCRQEMYDSTSKEIEEKISNPELYFDPKLFIHLLEYYFNCNIFIFTKKSGEGKIILPRHKQSYYKNLNLHKCIYIFEHWGSESDHAKFPQCEIIIRYNINKGVQNLLTRPQLIYTYKQAKNIRKIFSLINTTYALRKRITPIIFNLPDNIKIFSQWIDTYGKTRKINIKINLNSNIYKISLITTPIPPLNIKETTNSKTYYASKQQAQKLKEILPLSNIKENKDNITALIGNVNIKILFKDQTTRINRFKSVLKSYTHYKKYARYLVEYTFWMFSIFLKEKDIVKITDQVIVRFFRKKYTIQPEFQYQKIEKTFSTKSSLLKNKKIVIHSEEVLKRLAYVLKLALKRNIQEIIDYNYHKNIQNYYQDLSDFKTYHNQIILFGKNSVKNWILENNIKYVLYNEVQIGKREPYFFKNKLINNEIYLAQNSYNFQDAKNIATIWIKNKYNPGPSPPSFQSQKTLKKFAFYSYINSTNIKLESVPGIKYYEGIIIMGYKINNDTVFTTLMNLR
jgi:hypothetical protein